MRLNLSLLTLILAFIVLGCNKDDNQTLIGEWGYEYELMDDGTKNYEHPYALLEYEYSDGFILKKDKSGNPIWNENINGEFEWTKNWNKLLLYVTRDDNSIDEFNFKISNVTNTSMFFETPKGHKYKMKKK